MKLDPRTKLFIAVVANTILFSAPLYISLTMAALPTVLLLAERKIRFVILFALSYVVAAFLFYQLKGQNFGLFGTFISAPMFFLYRCMPICVLLYYVISITKVNEFMAGMLRMHMPNKITIPLAVMIRFFPTVLDEARDIGNAMHMRGIRLFSLRTLKNPLAILEYRLIPLLVSLTKIGDELSVAATTRGLSPETRRSCIVKIGFHVQDVVVFVYCIAVVVLFCSRSVT